MRNEWYLGVSTGKDQALFYEIIAGLLHRKLII
jgi:hypothetical protein